MTGNNRIGASCWFRVYDRTAKKVGPWQPGKMRMWGTDYEEFESGPGLYPVGVIEADDGLCHSVPVGRICFAAVPPNTPS